MHTSKGQISVIRSTKVHADGSNLRNPVRRSLGKLDKDTASIRHPTRIQGSEYTPYYGLDGSLNDASLAVSRLERHWIIVGDSERSQSGILDGTWWNHLQPKPTGFRIHVVTGLYDRQGVCHFGLSMVIALIA